MTLLAISCPDVYMHNVRFWRNQRKQNTSPSFNSSASTLQSWFTPYAGGTFTIFNWEKNEVTWQAAIDGVGGFCWRDGFLYVILGRFSEIVALDGYGREHHRLSHKGLNDVHTIVPTSRGFLLSNTGTDSIIEIDPHGKLLYEWRACEHGYPLLGSGRRRILNHSLDQRYIVYPNMGHTTHLNSARFADSPESIILTTLFYQGTIISIERKSGHAQTLLKGLNNPHDLRPYTDKGWIVSDSRNDQTLLLDEHWQITRCIARDFDWVQSSTPLRDGSIIITDTNNHRLVRAYVNDQDRYETRQFPPDWRLYLVEEVPPEYELFFQLPIASSPL